MEQRASRLGREIGRDCLAVRLRLLNRSVTRLYDAALRPYSITIAQLNLLASVANLQPIPSGKLADLLSLEISTLSRNARLMESAGWLEISAADHGNGRVLSLTPAGEGKLAELGPAWHEAQNEAVKLIGDGAAAAIREAANEHFVEQARQL